MDLSEKSWTIMRELLETIVDRRIALSEKRAGAMFPTKEDLKQFATKDDIAGMNKRFDRLEVKLDSHIGTHQHELIHGAVENIGSS